MTFYHRTQSEKAAKIIAEGFRDGDGDYMVEGHSFTGVWLSNVPLDSNEGADGDVLLLVTLNLNESELADYEWVEDDKPYREWLIPAALVNAHGQVVIAPDDHSLIFRY